MEVPFFWRGAGTLLVSPAGVVGVLRSIEMNGYQILGLEGFELRGPDVQPRFEFIFDSEAGGGQDPITVVSTWPSAIWIDITLDDGPG
jgi:hypothetical protein